MSNSPDAVARRVEAAKAAHERIRQATAAVDAANQAVIKAQAQVGPKLRELGIDHVLDDTEYDRTVVAPIIDRAGRTVGFKSHPDFQPLADAEKKQAEAFAELEAALCERRPHGWDRDRDAPDFISLADVEPWLEQILAGILNLKKDHKPTEDAIAAVTARDIGNFYRVLNHLRIADWPERKPPPTNILQAEDAVMDLLAWVRRRLSERTTAQAIAELRASLVAVRNRVEQIAKTVSPDDYEHYGEAAAHKYQRGDDEGARAVRNQLFEVLLMSFAPLADHITDTLGNDQFPTNLVPPTPDELAEKLVVHFVPSFRPERLDMDLFNLQAPDLTLAGKLMLVWAKWANVPGRDRPTAYRDGSYLPWAAELVNRYREDPHTWRVLVQPFDWAIRAFDEVANKITQPPERSPLLTPEVRAAIQRLQDESGLERVELLIASRQPSTTKPTDQAQPPTTGADGEGEGAAGKKRMRKRRQRGRRRGNYDESLHQRIYAAYLASKDYDVTASRCGVSIDQARLIVKRHRERERRKGDKQSRRKRKPK